MNLFRVQEQQDDLFNVEHKIYKIYEEKLIHKKKQKY